VESSRPIYKQHFTKILLAYSIWLNEIKFNIKELPPNQKFFSQSFSQAVNENLSESLTSEASKEANSTRREKLFFMLLGLSLETLSNTALLTQLGDETIEDILESISYLLKIEASKTFMANKSIHLCVEILSILYK
jgi:hypothetical protein